MDPSVLLKALSELLGPTGAIQGPDEATRIASLMKDATKIVSKCIYINILKLETPKETSEKLLSAGGWDILNDWLQSWKDEENFPLMIELLKVYQTLPVTVEILKKNNAAKTIKQLCKSDNDSVKTLATNIFDEWMKKVKGNNNNNTVNDESKSKKTKKDKDKDCKNSDNKSESNSDNKSKSRDSKHHSSSSHRDRDREKKSEHERNKDKTEEEMETSSNNSSVSEDAPTVRKGNGLKLTIKLGSDKDKERTQSSTKSDNKRGLKSDGTSSGSSDIIKRPSTVKIPPGKFRSIGLEEESVSSKASKPSPNDPNKVVPKRTGSDMKGDLTIKRPRLNMPPPPLSVPSPLVNTATTSGVTTPSTSSPTSPSEQHGKIKLIPARAKSNHAILESTGFMDSLTTTSRTYGAYKKKRRLSTSGNGPGKVPSTPPSPLSPTTATAKSLPSVPSFYKDTQEEAKEPSPEKDEKEELKKERSPSPIDNLTNPGVEAELTNIDVKPDTLDTPEVKRERSITPEFGKKAVFLESETKAESKGLLTAGGATKKKKKKKCVRWKEEKDLKEVFFFELDEDERENVNRPKDFKQAMKADIMCDRLAMETVRRLGHDNMNEQIIWYRPKLFPDVVEQDYGKDSEEKNVQRTREQGVLQAIFFNKTMLPDNPQEPDFEHQEHTDPKVIPIDDVSGGEECMYKHDEHPESIKNAPAAVNHAHDPQLHQLQQPPPQHQLPMGVGPPPPNLSLPPGLNLPPDLMNLLGQIQNGPQDPNNPVMTQVQLILNGLMSGNEQGYEQLQQIQHMMNSSMGLPPDALLQGPPPGMPPMGMPPQGPPMGPRTPLLGTAPPGYLPPRPMGPPPNRFGPGPPPGNWGQNMGGGPMGMPPHQGHKNRQQGGGYRGNRGRGRPQPIINNNHGAPRQKKILCRHFAQGMCRLGSNCNFLHTLPETDNKDKGHS